MSTTLKLSDELRSRVAVLAVEAGVSPHAYMVSALDEHTARAQQRQAFVRSALAARQDLAQGDGSYVWDELRSHYQAKLAGRKTRRPRLSK